MIDGEFERSIDPVVKATDDKMDAALRNQVEQIEGLFGDHDAALPPFVDPLADIGLDIAFPGDPGPEDFGLEP